jgi:threonine dehydratase
MHTGLSTPTASPTASLNAADVLAAAARIRPIIRRTRLLRSIALSELAGGDVYLKLENEQITGSFKLRGATNVLATLPAEARRRGVVASSAGNHGMGVAYAAKHFGAPATIFVPRGVAQVKRDGITALGAAIDTSQPHYDAAMDAALAFAEAHGSTFINPCAGDALIAGQGTVALEILEDLPDVAALVVSVGGGGLLGGCASLTRAVAPTTRMIGAQSVNTAAMSLSVAAGRVVQIENLPTLAEGLAGQVDAYALDIARRTLDEIVTVTEADIARTIGWLWTDLQQRVEGAGACAAAAMLTGKIRDIPTPAAVVVSGGNIDVERFEQLVAGL